MSSDLKSVHLRDAAGEGMTSGDLLLYRAGRSLAELVISRVGRTRYAHAARAFLGFKGWRSLETRAWHGGRKLPLAGEVKLYPRRIDVFEPMIGVARVWDCEYVPEKAVRWLADNVVGKPYGWRSIFGTACLHLPVVRFLTRIQTQDDVENGGTAPYCSHAQAMADRAAGFDPVPYLADRLTEPGDLARSLFYRYRFTLEP